MLIKDMIIVSDLDGTVVPMSGEISQRNKDAIAKFKSLGGDFTIATGRTPKRASAFAKELMVEGAFIASNGSVLYDNTKCKAICNLCFSEQSNKYIEKLINTFPHIGLMLIDSNYRYHVVNNSETMKEFVSSMNLEDITFYSNGDFPQNCCCGWFALDKDEFVEICLWIAHNKTDDIAFAVSGERFIDILPGGISKGTLLERLVSEGYNKSIENTVAIGDFPNDVTMLQKAKLGVAVANAHDEVKAVADMMVKSCEEDAIADLIEYLIANES